MKICDFTIGKELAKRKYEIIYLPVETLQKPLNIFLLHFYIVKKGTAYFLLVELKVSLSRFDSVFLPEVQMTVKILSFILEQNRIE